MERWIRSHATDWKVWTVLSLTFLSFVVRYNGLFDRPYWIDEIIFLNLLKNGYFAQVREFIPVTIALLTDQVRLIPYISGALLPFAMYVVVENKRNILPYCFIVTFASIFVFWSQLARPYITGALFAVLGYRWAVFYIAVIFTNPACLIPNIYKLRWWYVILFVGAYIVYSSQPLSKLDHFNLEYMYHAKRLWLAPLAVSFVHLADFTVHRLQWIRRCYERLARQTV